MDAGVLLEGRNPALMFVNYATDFLETRFDGTDPFLDTAKPLLDVVQPFANFRHHDPRAIKVRAACRVNFPGETHERFREDAISARFWALSCCSFFIFCFGDSSREMGSHPAARSFRLSWACALFLAMRAASARCHKSGCSWRNASSLAIDCWR